MCFLPAKIFTEPIALSIETIHPKMQPLPQEILLIKLRHSWSFGGRTLVTLRECFTRRPAVQCSFYRTFVIFSYTQHDLWAIEDNEDFQNFKIFSFLVKNSLRNKFFFCTWGLRTLNLEQLLWLINKMSILER